MFNPLYQNLPRSILENGMTQVLWPGQRGYNEQEYKNEKLKV